MSQSPILKCGACAHENEPERVYCHNCGQKLDRSVLPKPEAKKDVESAEVQRRRLDRMVNPVNTRKNIVTFVQVMIFAALLAAVYLYFQKPNGLPPEKIDTIPERNPGEIWAQMKEAKPGFAQQFNETEVNYWLSRTLKAGDSAVPGVKFLRAFVKLDSGVIQVSVQRDAWGLPAYSTVTLRPVEKNGGVSFEVIGTHFGKLGVHPAISWFGRTALDSVSKALAKDLEGINRIKSVEIANGAITITTNPAP